MERKAKASGIITKGVRAGSRAGLQLLKNAKVWRIMVQCAGRHILAQLQGTSRCISVSDTGVFQHLVQRGRQDALR